MASEERKEATIIDGKAIAQTIRNEIASEVLLLSQKYGKVPGLAVVIVGNRKDSQSYVNMKRKACCELGIRSYDIDLPAEVSEEEVVKKVHELNADPDVHGILVQLPLPKHINEEKVLTEISIEKDVDGFHPLNIGKLAMKGREPLFQPCTPKGCVELLTRSGVSIKGKNAVVVGRSNIVGLPVALLLLKADATVTVVHSHTRDSESIIRSADIIIAAAGQPMMIKGDWIKPGAAVIDVGTNAIDDPSRKSGYRLVGDVDFQEVKKVAGLLTPVPGGVGPMTVAMLLKNTLDGAKQMDIDMIDEEVQCINVGQSSGAKRGKRDTKNVTWTEIADEFLTNVLIEQITLGRKDGVGFTSEGWREIERKMKEKFGDAYDKAKIRNRLRTVKGHYNHIKILMGLSGFGWDDITKRVTAEDQVWDDYIKAHPDYGYYRGRSFPDYEKFAIIYGDSIADGRDVILTNQRQSHPLEAPKSNHDKDMAAESSSSEKRDESISKAARTKKHSTVSSRRIVRDENRADGDKKTDFDIARAVKDLTNTLMFVADKMAQSGPSQADVVAAILELDLEQTLQIRALRLLRDPQVAGQFLALATKDRRHAFLMAELDSSI